MSDKIYKCKNCGAQVTNIIDNIGRCEHCGSPYEIIVERKEKDTVPFYCGNNETAGIY